MLFEDKGYLQFTLNKSNQRYYVELLKNEIEVTDSEILREVFLRYAVLKPFLREIYLFREKLTFMYSSMKESKLLKIDSKLGIIEGKIEKIYRCKETNYLKILINGQCFYYGEIRVISSRRG